VANSVRSFETSTTWLVARACTLGLAILAASARGAEPAGGIRKLESKHLTLYTDLPPSDEVDALPGYFDQAYPQWCDYFGVAPAKHAAWRATGCLMKAQERFQAAGLIPRELPQLQSGYTREDRFWLAEQNGDYYRRHLLLHEGTHAFMYSLMSGQCASWYFEGLAELMATHRLDEGKLLLHQFPRLRQEVPRLGRIEIVQNAVAAGKPMSLEGIFAYNGGEPSRTEPYAWCWATAAFFDGSPIYQQRFRALAKRVAEPDFPQHVHEAFTTGWPRAGDEWRLFIANLDYGYDFSRMQIDFEPGKPLTAGAAQSTVAADRGWQSSGVQLVAGKRYKLRASGRYQIDNRPRIWNCEPGGVTIEYYRGRPLGMLLGAVCDDESKTATIDGLLDPVEIGLESTIAPEHSGTLYLRVNDSAGSLDNNAGTLSVAITDAS
jgi:hypothetical protein